MDEFTFQNLFRVKRICGKNEYDVYKNYTTDLPPSRIVAFLHELFETTIKKNDTKSVEIRKHGNTAYCDDEDYELSLGLYNRSLCYATYNSEAYGTTLANRSAVLFKMCDYKSCIQDVDRCLQTKYPDILKPKIIIRKAECYKKLGDVSRMRQTLVDVLNFIDETLYLSESVAEKYKDAVKNLIVERADEGPDEQIRYDILPTIDSNPLFPNASALVELQYHKRSGHHVVAKSEIVRGDILFVEKAFAFAPFYSMEMDTVVHCQNCLIKTTNCIPCKGCTKYVYCTDTCRDSAWNDFHKWECAGVQAGLFEIISNDHLPLRMIFKGLATGVSTNPVNFEGGAFKYGNVDDNYPYVYSIPSYIDKVDKDQLMKYAATAAVFVNYLKLKTDFFTCLKKWPAYANKGEKELANKVGSLIIRHYIQLRYNEILIDTFIPDQLPVATAICPSVTRMTHSCIPNTCHYFVGDTVVVKALKNIKPKEDICIAIGNTTWSSNKDTSLRRTKLRNEFFIKCQCQACTDPSMTMEAFDAYFCVACNGRAVCNTKTVLPSPIKACTCLDCGSKFLLPLEVFLKEDMFFAFMFKFLTLQDIEDANISLQLGKTIFKPYHSAFGILYQHIWKYYLNNKNISCLWKMSKMLVDRIDKVYGDFALENGFLRYKVCKAVSALLTVPAVNMDSDDLRKILDDMADFLNRAKSIIDLHYPLFLPNLEKLKKLISELQLLHTTHRSNNM